MSALPSFDPPVDPPRRRKSPLVRQPNRLKADSLGPLPTTPTAAPRMGSRVKSNPTYAHRRQGLEAVAKLVTYSALSLFGVVTLVNLIAYNWSQHRKLQHLETELQDAKQRAEKVNSNFSRSFDPHEQNSVMQENSYKISPDRRQIVFINPNTNRAVANPHK